MKKLILIVAISLVAILLLSACGNKTTTQSTTVQSSTTPSSQPAATSASTTAQTTKTLPPTSSSTSTAAANTPRSGGTLRYIYPYSPTSTPGWPNDRTNFQKIWATWTIFEPLIQMQKDGTPKPWLATSWDWGPQNANITFHLRQGVKFHDGTDFTAEAVKVEADEVISTKESNSVNWDRWEVIDDHTIKLYLKKYQNDFWGGLGGGNMTFFSPTAFKANGKAWMLEHPIGTGPFTFLSFEKDVSLKFKKFANYWQPGKPYLDEIDMITVKETMTQRATLESGDGDVLCLQQGKFLSDMKAKGFNVPFQYGGTDLLIYDSANQDSPFANIKVRQAIEYALDKQSMVDALGYGYLVKNNQMSPPDNPSYNPNVPSRDYNVEKAKEVLTAAGYPNGFSAKMITMGSSNKGLAVQADLKKIGIILEMEMADNAKFFDYCMKGWKNAILDTGYSIGTNYASFLKGYFPPVGIFDVSTKIPDSILAKIEPALDEQDPAKAKKLNDELIQMVFDDATFTPVYSNAMGYVLRPQVKGMGIFEYIDFMTWTPADTWLEK
jgi:peptide/nickel transport system substrate-binding protein